MSGCSSKWISLEVVRLLLPLSCNLCLYIGLVFFGFLLVFWLLFVVFSFVSCGWVLMIISSFIWMIVILYPCPSPGVDGVSNIWDFLILDSVPKCRGEVWCHQIYGARLSILSIWSICQLQPSCVIQNFLQLKLRRSGAAYAQPFLAS